MNLKKIELLQNRAQFRTLIREFFSTQGFCEVVTPLLVSNPGLEPNILYFETEFTPLMGRGKKQKLYLPTSPEYHLKKVLSWGAPKIFEMTRAFRNGEWGREHFPEFEMLEWYRQPGSYEEIAKDVEGLLKKLWNAFKKNKTTPIELGEIKHYQVKDLFLKHAQINLDHPIESDEFHQIFVEKIDPVLEKENLVFLWNFPASLRALSKLDEKDPRYCKRFEVYWRGIELGNAFDELVDVQELRKVCESDRQKRLEKYAKSPDLDEAFIEAHHYLAKNMGGIAMGIDRLFQWAVGAENLSEVLLFESLQSE
jgi:lysyl-tRNA synthetase class 2